MKILRLMAAIVVMSAIASKLSAQDNLNGAETFNPKDLDDLEMFLESVKGLAIATNTSQPAYEKTGENTVLEEVWSDKQRFPHGTIRWWLDQSPYTNDKKIRPSRVFKTGRDIGQDDHDRPGYIPEGCNGKPCIRGGLIGTGRGDKHNKQPCYFELQLESRDFKIDGPFGLFLLARPVQQENDAAIMGQFHRSVLIQNVEKSRLEWKNLGKPIPVSRENTLKTDTWQLVELHRDAHHNLTCLINGKGVTVGKPKDRNPFVFMFLFNNNKGQGFARQDPFAGDIAALVIYRDESLMSTSCQKCRIVYFVAIAVYAASPALAQSNYALDDLEHEVRLSSVEISPDGKQLAVVARRPDYEKNRFINQLFLVEVANGHTRPLTFDRPNIQQPHWSPDGERIAFMAASKKGRQQVFVMDMRGGEGRNVTELDQNIGWFCWAPNGHTLAFTAAAPSSEENGEQKHNKAFEVTRDSYLADSPAQPIHLWVLDLQQGDTRQLTFGTESVVSPFGAPFDFSPDGRSLVYVARPSPEEGFLVNLTLKSIELASGKTSTLVSKPSILGIPRFSPDGEWVSYMAPRGPELSFGPFSVFTVPVSSGEPVDAVSKLDRSITGNWIPQSQTLLLKGANLTKSSAWLQELNGTPELLDLGDVHIEGFERELSASESGVIAFVGSQPGQPADVYRLDPADGKPRKLTEFNAKLSSKRAGKVETITWECHDGFQANGVLVYPPGYKQGLKYPLVLNIHGGPMYHSTEAFSLWNQIMAAKGWIVFRPNYRGSDNQGRRFQTAIINDAGEGPGRDVMAGLAAIKERGIVDEGRVAVSGWSYGGFMTVWLTAHYHDWKAAVAGAPVTDWFDSYNLTDLNKWFGAGLGGSPWTNGNSQNYLRQSPITYAHQIQTPTLILSNTRDPRVTVTQSYKLFNALRDNNVPVKFIAYPIEGHFPADPTHERDALDRWISWIEKHFEE